MRNRGKLHLYSICGWKVKKFEMFSWQCSIQKMAHFLAFLGPNSSKYGLIFLKFAPQLVLMGSKTLFEFFFENENFYRNRTYPKFAGFFQFLSNFEPVFLHEGARNQKKKKVFSGCFQDKTTPSGYPKIAKSRPYLVPIFQEKYDYFLSCFGCFLMKKGAWSHVKGWESKFQLPYCSLTTLRHISVQRVGSQHIPVLSLSVPKVVFFQFQSTFSSLAALWVPHPLFLKK